MFPLQVTQNSLMETKSQLKKVTNLKLKKEIQALKLRSTERSLSEQLYSVKAEIDLLTQQLEEIKDNIYQTNYKISTTEILKKSEECKIDSRVIFMSAHEKQFDELFERERGSMQLRAMELKQKQLEEEEQERLKQNKVQEELEMRAIAIANVDEETNAIERECAVLKKRNNAIMLKLRRKLIETEETRKELLKKLHASEL